MALKAGQQFPPILHNHYRALKDLSQYSHLLATEIGNNTSLEEKFCHRHIVLFLVYSVVNENSFGPYFFQTCHWTCCHGNCWSHRMQGSEQWSTLHYLQSTSVLSSNARIAMSSKAGKWSSPVCQNQNFSLSFGQRALQSYLPEAIFNWRPFWFHAVERKCFRMTTAESLC